MRDRILTESLQLMNEQGLNFTLADLAAQLAVSKRRIYQYFSSKEALINAVLDEILDDLQQQVATIVGRSGEGLVPQLKSLMVTSPKALGPLSVVMIHDVKRQMPEAWLKFENFFQDKWAHIESLIRRGEEEGLFRDVSLDILRQMYRGSINELGDYRFLARSGSTFQNTMERTVDILIFGVIAAPSRCSACADGGCGCEV